MPCSMARFAAPSAESAAAYGVLLREPLKPATPAEPQLMTAPLRSVIVMIVLLKVAWMWTCPCGTFFFSLRRCLTAFLRSAMRGQSPVTSCAARRPSSSVRDPAARQVVLGQLDSDAVTGQDPDEVHPQLAADVGEHPVAILQLDCEHRVGQRFDDRTFHFDRISFGHRLRASLSHAQCRPGRGRHTNA